MLMVQGFEKLVECAEACAKQSLFRCLGVELGFFQVPCAQETRDARALFSSGARIFRENLISKIETVERLAHQQTATTAGASGPLLDIVPIG